MSAVKQDNRPNTLWPVGTKVVFVDAWGANAFSGKVTRHYGQVEVLIEHTSGVVYFCQTWRILSEPPAAERVSEAALKAMFE